MRILLDGTSLVKGGGLQVGLAILHNAAHTPEHEWHLALSAEMGEQLEAEISTAFQSVTVLDKAHSWRKALAVRRALPSLERSIHPDLVFTIFGPPFWNARAPHLVGFALPMPLYPDSLLWSQLSPIRRLKQKLNYGIKCWSLRWADFLVVETETVRRRLQSVLGFPAERTFVVRNSYSPIFAHARELVPPPSEVFSILVPSSYYAHKNLEIVPRTAAFLQKLIDLPFIFTFTLPAEESPWKNIAAEAARLGVGNRLRTLGPVAHRDIAALYRSARAVFLPTLLECSTAVYPESFAAGVPLCTTDIDFARELCGDAALYCDATCPQSAAQVLARLVNDKPLRAALVDRGVSVLRDHYPTPEQKWRDQLACFEAIYKS